MSSAGAAPRAAVSSARAAASRKNGARSRGPRTAEGKARSARNALKHGLRAEKYVVLPDEDRDEFAALEAAFIDELAPAGALQRILAGRVARAAWRLMRADRLEVELFEERGGGDRGVGLALVRDGNGTRSFETLLRYRGAAQAELWRALRTLKALQAEQSATPPARAAAPAAVLRLQPKVAPTGTTTLRAPTRGAGAGEPHENPIEPKADGILGESGPASSPDEPEQLPGPARARTNEPEPAPCGTPRAPTARPLAERTPSWAGRGRSGGRAASGTNGARSGRTAPGAPESSCAADRSLRGRPPSNQLARSTP
ncbi:MAG: hypothetical protein K0S35_2063 [Geminicoccaceae bacterium]|nr:hypothetical protein [Geminicoccaceae bacterium]